MVLLPEDRETAISHPGEQIFIKKQFNKNSSFFGKECSTMTPFQKKLCDFYVMRKMRERFGELPHNSEKHFPDPRIRRLTRTIPDE